MILPFEVDFYKPYGIDAEYYGNPVLDSIEAFMQDYDSKKDLPLVKDDRPIIALLAGSRKQEIDNLLPEMLSVIGHFPDFRFVIAGAPSISPEYYQKYISGNNVDVVYNKTYTLLKMAEAAVVTSGTATLETALLGVPEVIVYKTSALTFFIGSFFLKIKFFSLVNLILNKEAVKELLQKNLSPDIKKELDKILYDPQYRSVMLENYRQLRQILGDPGVSGKVAGRINELLIEKQHVSGKMT